ncbi:efflux RND transporter periplasmic adaptor subunit [Alteromonas sp. H39]|uniref:efflux RND transporter periplasmic adaptor subunit n=1 Tax=Alteromonas sp. H39 TaxID=3389876 RepID=UPI0039E15C8E
MSRKSIFSPLVLAVVVLAGFLAYLFIPQDEVAETRQGRPTPVKAEQVKRVPFPVTIEALGTANANESVTLTAQEADIVSEVMFEDGETVEAGQLLIQLNNEEELARIEELEANIEEARRQLDRVQNLRASSAASEQLFDEQQARVKALRAQLDVAKAQLRNLQVRAPFAGLLGIRAVSKGSLIRPADVITTLDDTSVMKVDFSVAENHLASLAPGQRITASSVAYPGASFDGTISTIDSRVDPVSRSVLVRAIIDNEDGRLRPGMLLQITVEKRVLDALVVPEKALVPVQDKQFVFVVEGEAVRETEVTLGERKPGLVQIIDGLSEGELVVTEGTLRVRDGSKVNVLNASKEG